METVGRETLKLDKPCKIWTGGKDKDGYGLTKHNGKTITAHRLAWIRCYGSNPKGKTIRHLCHVRACYEVSHLSLGSHQDNMEDKKARVTHCSRGHEWTEENTFYDKDGCRNCRKCRSLTSRRYYLSKK